MPTNRYTLPALNATVTLGAVSDRVNGEWQVHISGTFVGTVQTKSYLPNGTSATLALADRQPIAYKVGKTGTLTDPTTTGITAVGVYQIPARAGEIVVLECTAYTSGTVVIDARPSPQAG